MLSLSTLPEELQPMSVTVSNARVAFIFSSGSCLLLETVNEHEAHTVSVQTFCLTHPECNHPICGEIRLSGDTAKPAFTFSSGVCLILETNSF